MSKQNSVPSSPRPVIAPIAQTEPPPTATPTTSTESLRTDYESHKSETLAREARDVSKRIIKHIIWTIASVCLLWFALREKRLLDTQ